MSKIITFANQKGGVGKSTLTSLTATALAQPPFNYSVFVADVDQQQSLARRRLNDLKNSERIPPYKLEFKTMPQLLGELEEIDKAHDFVFIDAPGKLDASLPADRQEITKVLLIADYLFIPIVPGNYTMEATLDFLKVALRIKAQRKERPLDVYALVNMAEPRTIDDVFLREELEELKALINISTMEAPLNRYTLYRAADTLESIYEADSKDKAKAKFAEWLEEFISLIK